MRRSTFILGFSLLVITATLAASIHMRNPPNVRRNVDPSMAGRPQAGSPRTPVLARISKPSKPQVLTNSQAKTFRVDLPESWLAGLPAEQQLAWKARTAAIGQTARARLEHLSAELQLTAAQCGRIFPVIVSATPGYDPIMRVAGTVVQADPLLATTEEIHSLLDSKQQALVEDQEVNRQLWWQDTFARLEVGLIEGGSIGSGTPEVIATAPSDPLPAIEERVVPNEPETGNLFDLLQANP